MRNIGIFTHDLYPFKLWGQGRYVYDLIKHARSKYKRKIFVFSPSEGVNDELHIQIFPGSHNSIGRNITFSIKLACVIERLIEKYHLGLAHFQGGPGGLFVIRHPSVPLIYTVHHTYYQQFKYIPSQKWKKILYLWEKFSYSKSDYIICVSDSTRRIISRYYGAGKDYCATIPNGVDQLRFYPLGLQRIPNSLFFLGRLEKRKGIDFLIRAIPTVKQAISEIHLFIGGDGILRAHLENFVKRESLENNVTFLGTVDDSQVNEWYNKVSLVVVPSSFEGFGLTAIEAMACGTPVIATNVDALRDVIEDGVNALLVKYNDVENMSDKIVILLKDKNKQAQLVRNGRQRVEETYNWNRISERIVSAYNGIIS